MRKNTSKLFVASSFGQKVWSTFPIAQCWVASPLQCRQCCLLLNEIKKINVLTRYRLLYINIWSVHADAVITIGGALYDVDVFKKITFKILNRYDGFQ